jgi:hypothetical protein
VRRVIFVLAVQACAAGHVPYRATLYAGVVYEAAAQWCEASSGRCCPRINESVTLVETDQEECQILFQSPCSGWWSGNAIKTGTVGFALNDIKSEAGLHNVALHEFGHWCGLHHTDDPKDVMFKFHTTQTKLSKGDIEAYWKLQKTPK